MTFALDPSLPPALYPLAWLVGSWEGSGAVHHRPDAPAEGAPPADAAADGLGRDRRIEQRLDCVPQADGTLAWTSLIHELDDPAPLPPTSAFARQDAPSPAAGSGERRLLMKEQGIWSVGELLPGQDLAAAERARPGDPAAVLSYRLQARFTRDGVEHDWAGEVRGPRIQLARRSTDPTREPSALSARPAIEETRMFGYVSGRLMWLWERRSDDAEQGLIPYLSLELNRV